MKRIVRLTERDLSRIVRRVVNEQPVEELPDIESCNPNKFEEFMNSVAESTSAPMKLENAPDGNKAFILLTFPNGQRCAVKKSEITFGI